MKGSTGCPTTLVSTKAMRRAFRKACNRARGRVKKGIGKGAIAKLPDPRIFEKPVYVIPKGKN